MRVIVKKYSQLTNKEKYFLLKAYEEAFNKAGFNENLFFRKLFATFYLLYEQDNLVASASILFGRLDHLYSDIKWKGYGTYLLKTTNPRIIEVPKNKYSTNSLIAFYSSFGYKMSKSINKQYFCLRKP